MLLQITNDDIDKVERLLLQSDAKFCEARRVFIRSLDSLDVQACPGSGKTTALLAKLLILSSKLPLPDNAGICILTHTNTAIDEIKKQFGKQASGIFQYPHYVGTIQTFVDKFLAIPAFVNRYGKRPVAIDNEQFNYEIERSQGANLNKARFYLTQNYLTLSSLRFSFENSFISKSLNDEQPFVGKNTPTYESIEQHKLKVLEKGYLCFDDAYALAYQYIQQYPQICTLISMRFKYVFIDEMQDTDIHQNRIFDAIFPSDQTVVQRIGDQNQAIYTYDVKEELIWQPKNLIYINGSKRFSQSIATAIKNVGLAPQELEGDATKPAIKPVLILFEDADITQVIPCFCELILKYELPSLTDKPVFKVIGWVGKEHQDKHTIPNYWPAHINMRKYKKTERNCLDDFIGLPIGDTSAAFYASSLVDGILRFLKINGVTRSDGRHFTPTTFFSYLEEKQPDLYDKLKLNLTKWVFQISLGIDVFAQVKDFLICQLANDSKCGFRLNTPEIHSFFNRANQPNSCENTMPSMKLPGDIPVIVNTIHSVKGETHMATLYLETFNNGYDVSNILHCFCPNAKRGKLGTTQKRSLKMAYVAMSRPTHLLCVAVHKNTLGARNKQITHDFGELQNNLGKYWQILDISNHVS